MSVNQVKTLFLDDGITVSPPANVMTASGSFVSYTNDAAFVTGKGSAAADGDAYYNTTDDVVRYYSDGAWSTFIDNDSSQNMSGKTVTDNMVFSSTGAIKLPSGTTGQRPTPSAGQIRYNSTTGGFEGYTDKWGSIGGGATPIAIDHTTTSLELNAFYAIDMSGASGNVTFTFPDMVDGDQFKALVFGNDTNGYLATFQTTSPQNMYYRGSTDTSIQLTVADTWVGGLWDNNNSYVAVYDASTFLSGTLAGDWVVDGDLSSESHAVTGTGIISDGVNVDNIGILSFGTAGTINGLTGGIVGQIIHVYGSTSTSSVVFAHNSGSDTKFLCPAGVDLSIISGYGGCSLHKVSDNYWVVTGATGYLGERQFASETSGVSAVSNANTTVDSLVLPAGTWRISAGIAILKGGSTFAALAELRAGITDDGSTGISGIDGAATAYGCIRIPLNQANSTAITMTSIGPVVETYTTSTTINLNYNFIFSGTTPTIRCHILAERIG